MRFAAFGRTHWLYDSILSCNAKGHKVVLIGTCPAAPEYTRNERDFETLARQLGCPFFCDPKINKPDYARMAKDSGAEVAISVNWLTIVGENMLSQFKHGIINAHAGDLPRFRGNAVPNWAILAGEKKIVVSLHKMTPSLDAGPVLMKRALDISTDTYISDVYKFLSASIPEMFVRVLDGLSAGQITPVEQTNDSTRIMRCLPRIPSDGQIRWENPAEELSRLVHASAEPFAGAYTFIGLEKLVVWKAHAEQLAFEHLGVPGQVTEIRPGTGEVAALTADGILVLEEVETISAGRRNASDIIKSTRVRLGLDVAGTISQIREDLIKLQNDMRRFMDSGAK